jgi:hypothetical protein
MPPALAPTLLIEGNLPRGVYIPKIAFHYRMVCMPDSKRTNAKQRGLDWQFRIENARLKLKWLCPKIKT